MNNYGPIVFGMAIGAMTVSAVASFIPQVTPLLTNLWCRSPRGKDDRRFRRRIRWALSPNKLNMFAPLVLGIFNPVYLLMLLGGYPALVGGSALATYILGSVLILPLSPHRPLGNFRKALASAAIYKLVKIGDNAFAEELLLRAAASSEPLMRIVSTIGLRELGTPAGNAALDKLCADRDMDVSVAACYAATDLKKALGGKDIISLQGLPALLEEHRKYVHTVRMYPRDATKVTRQGLADTTQRIERILFSQLLLRRSFPQVYCQQCHAYAELKAHEDWRWVSCAVCEDAVSLRAGIATVVGQIGGESAWMQEGNALKISLWDRDTRRVIPGEIDSLEIVGGQDMDYDWALSAVVEMLRNRRKEGQKRIPIILTDAPALSNNSRHLIADFEGGV